jgi:hypothetical protein
MSFLGELGGGGRFYGVEEGEGDADEGKTGCELFHFVIRNGSKPIHFALDGVGSSLLRQKTVQIRYGVRVWRSKIVIRP